MTAQLLGIQHINFTNNSGEVINGMNLFIAFPEENVEGLRVERLYIKDGINIPKDIKFNDKIELSFNYKGKIEAIHKAN